MTTVRIRVSSDYDVRISPGLLSRVPEQILSLPEIREGSSLPSVCVVSDDRVFGLYGAPLLDSLRTAGFRAVPFVFPHGESGKSLSVYESLAETLAAGTFSRTDLIAALGGGVTGDLAGFAAGTVFRGMRLIQIPTTLLAAVDASVGGKAALNLKAGKNLIGCFRQPSLVLCDPDVFRTLSPEDYRNGCAEIIKCAMLDGPEFCGDLLRTPVSEHFESVIARCVEIKRSYVERDETDRSVRRFLNFGHTAGHAMESASGYRLPHGAAVAAGMAVMARASAAKGFCGTDVPAFLESLLQAYGLPTGTDLPAAELAAEAKKDKKSRGDLVTLVLPDAVGHCFLRDAPKSSLEDWFRAGGCR